MAYMRNMAILTQREPIARQRKARMSGRAWASYRKAVRKASKTRSSGINSPEDTAEVSYVAIHKGSAFYTPSWADRMHNVRRGQEVMARLGRTIATPGVELRETLAAPLFRADPSNPGQLIRKQGGQEETVVWRDGAFQVVS